MKFSASSLKSFATCPLQYKLQEIEEREGLLYAQTVYGSCIHEALDRYNKGDSLDEATATFLECWDEPERVGQREPDIWTKNTSYHSLRQRGKETLAAYDEKVKWQDRIILASEHRFKVPIGDHELSGIVDLIDVRKNSKGERVLCITDYKSTSRQPTKDALHYDLQFVAYYAASLLPEFWFGTDSAEEEDRKYEPLPNAQDVYDMFFNLPRNLVWYHLHTNKEIMIGGKSEQDIQRLYLAMEGMAKSIEQDVFMPNISGTSCNLCPFAEDLCPSTAPVFHDIIRRKEKLEKEVF